MKCLVCNLQETSRHLVRILWSVSKDAMELQSDIRSGHAHRNCVEQHNENCGDPHYCIAEKAANRV